MSASAPVNNEDKRVVLGLLSLQDCQLLWDWADAENKASNASSEPQVPDAAAWHAQILAAQHKTHIRYGIYLDGQVIGDVALQDIDWEEPAASIGMTLRKDMRSKGYGKAALALMLEQAEEKLGAARIWARTRTSNIAAIRCLQGAGFVLTKQSGDHLTFTAT